MLFGRPVENQTLNRIIIVGAGLAGLSCAVRLLERGKQVLLVEGSDRAGGRLRTEKHQGYLMDRGFQVFLSAYPEAGKLLDLKALNLQSFRPGSLVFKNGKFHRLMDVFRCPRYAISTALQPIGSFRDKLLVAKLRMETLLRNNLSAARKELTTEEFLQDYGFSQDMIDVFFRAFYGGIFLERDLRTSCRMFEFTFRMFAKGNATLPANGIEEIPKQLEGRLPRNTILFNSPVNSVRHDGITLTNGESLSAKQVVLATDIETTNRLLPLPGEKSRSWRSVAGMYFAAPISPINEPIIALNGEGCGLVNNVCAVSDVSTGYAPRDKALMSVSILGMPEDKNLEEEVRGELRVWFGEQVDKWQHLRTDRIRRALPEQSPMEDPGDSCGYQVRDGVMVCGDHCTTASIEGAIVSGLRSADALCS